jgi:hypothetical protein
MLKHILHLPDRSETSPHWRDRFYELEYRLVDRLLAWEARSAAEAEHRCDRISAAARRAVRRCLRRRQVGRQ